MTMGKTRDAAGVNTNFAVLDVQAEMAEARLLETKARFEVVLASYALERAVGESPW